MTTHLVTGGAGFLGSALANHLAAQGHHVRVLDDLSAGDAQRLSAEVSFASGDTRDIPKLWSLLRGVDCVYHLAARVSVPESILYPVEYNAVNVGGTVSLLTAMRDAQIKRLVFASSGSIYGEQEHQPIAESAPLHPATPYAVSKMASEQYIQAIGRLWGIETVILRIFNAYGPQQPLPPSHAPVIPRFLRQVTTGGSVVTFGTGLQTRDFVYVSDVVQALASAGTQEGIAGETLNIGSGTECSIQELIDTLERVTNQRAERLENPQKSGEVSRLVADISLAQARLNYQPQVSLDEGLERMIKADPRFAIP